MAHPRGNYGDVSLDALNVVVLGSFGNIWTGEAKNSVSGFFRSGQTLLSAKRSRRSLPGCGWPTGFAELMEEVLGFESAPIDFEIADDWLGGGPSVPARWRRARGRSPGRRLLREGACRS